MRAPLGVIGVGELASALVTGLCEAARPPGEIVVSPRNAPTAAALAERFEAVRVAASNQEVVDQCERLLLAVRPQVAREVVGELVLRPGQDVVSLMAPIDDEWLIDALAPARLESRVLVLPGAARGEGPVAVQPGSDDVNELFGRVGSVMSVPEREDLITLSALSSWAAPVYGVIAAATGWAAGQGADPQVAGDYFAAVLKVFVDAAAAPGAPPPDVLVRQAQTPGGLNEQAVELLDAQGWFEQIAGVLEDVRARLAGPAR